MPPGEADRASAPRRGLGQRTGAQVGAWRREPPLVEERSQTDPDAPAFRVWNKMSPEYEFCRLVGALVAMLKPRLVVESGVGQGFTTRRIAAELPAGATLRAFESDDDWRQRLAGLPFFDGEAHELSDRPAPGDADLAEADLFVADSNFEFRFDEVERWAAVARPGATIAVHDTGNQHAEWTPHHRLGELIAARGIAGIRLPNPRGSFVGQR